MIEALRAQARAFLAVWVTAMARRAWMVTILALLTSLLSGWFVVTHMAINTDTSDMLSPELPFRKLGKALDAAFPQYNDNLLIVVDGATPDLADRAALKLAQALRQRPTSFRMVQDIAGEAYFRTNGLLYLDEAELAKLADQLAKAQPFLASLWRDPSLVGLADILGLALDAIAKGQAGPGLSIDPVLNALADVTEASNQGRFASLSWQNLMQGDDPAKPGRRMILTQPALDFGSLAPAKAAMREVRKLATELGLTEENGIRVRLTGSAALSQEELESVEEGMGIANILSLLLVGLLLVVGLKDWRLVGAVFITLLMGLVYSAAYALFAVGRLNLISVAFAVLFIGLGVDFGIHFALRYREGRDQGKDQLGALAWAAENVGGPMTLCALSAAIGFLSFLPTAYIGLAELGHIAGMSMAVALVANLTILPALLALMPIAAKPERLGKEPPPAGGVVLRHARITAIAALILAGLAALFLPKARFDFDPLNLKDPRTESVATLFELMKDKRTGPYSITILVADRNQALRLAQELKKLPEVESAVTIADYVPKDQEAKLESIEAMALLLSPLFLAERGPKPEPAARQVALTRLTAALKDHPGPAASRLAGALANAKADPESLLLLEERLVGTLPDRLTILRQALSAQTVSEADLPRDLVAGDVAADGRTKVKVYPKADLRDPDALVRFVTAVRAVAPEAAGTPVTIHEAGQAVVAAFQTATLATVILLALMLAMVLRKLRDTLLVFAPLVLAALVLVPITVIFDLPFNFANVIVLPLLFGLGIANGIQFVARERLEHDAAGLMASTTPRAVIFSALTTMVSFGSLAISSHPGTADMGLLLAIALTLTLASTLGVLPALMRVWPANKTATP